MKIQSTSQYSHLLYGREGYAEYVAYEELDDEININPKQIFYYKTTETGVDKNIRIEIEKVPKYITILN